VKLAPVLLSTILSCNAFGLVPSFSKPPRERGPSVTTSSGSSVTDTELSISSGAAVSIQSCTSRANDISLQFFRSLVDSSSGASITLMSFDPSSNKIQISLPGYISKCLSVKPNISKVFTDGNKQFSRLVLRNSKDMSRYKGSSMEDKIEDCLITENLLIKSADGMLSWSESVSDSLTEPQVITTKLKGSDIDPAMQLGFVFGSPKESPYEKGASLTSNSECYHDESLGESLTSLRDEKTANDNRIVNLCESLNLDDIQQELESQAKLEPYQQSLLSNVLRQAQEKYVEEKMATLEELGKEILEAENYDLVKDLGMQYLAQLESLDEEIIQPAKKEMMALAESLRGAKSTDERRQINIDMSKLSELIGALSNTSRSRILPQVLDKLLEFGQADTANRAALISIKSNEYAKAKRYIDSRSSGAKSRSVTRIFSSVDKIIASEHRKFKKRSDEARIVYEERSGLSKLSPQVKSELDRLVRIRDQRFDLAVRNIQRELAKCNKTVLGFMTAPISCKNAMKHQAEWYRQALSEKEKYNQRISKLASKYTFYSNLEKQAEDNDLGLGGEDLSSYNHQSGNYLGSYGMYGDFAYGADGADTHRIEERDLTSSSFSRSGDKSYQSFFSSPSRVAPYSNFNMPATQGYSFNN